MRVIAGSAKGRRLRSPRGRDTRPMASRAREALFSSLGDAVVGARVLDLFAGSGSLGIEALSRGAAAATFVEKAKPALDSLRANLDATGFAGEVIAGDVGAVVARLDGAFDLVFVDPPFEMAPGVAAAVRQPRRGAFFGAFAAGAAAGAAPASAGGASVPAGGGAALVGIRA